MAYDLGVRFLPPGDYYKLLDPGTYQIGNECALKQNKAPFLSKTTRSCKADSIWTHALYFADKRKRIPNCSSLLAKTPRFAYKETKEYVDDILCRCGINPCECPTDDIDQIICEASVPRRLYKGRLTFSAQGEGLSVPSHGHRGYDLRYDGSIRKRPRAIPEDKSVEADVHVHESTEFYRGCKWSKWTTKRKTTEEIPNTPGPADYDTLLKCPTPEEICDERVREHKRRTCRQLRFLDMMMERNLKENSPGPPHYNLTYPRGTVLKYLGPKTERFPYFSADEKPGPADYSIKRNFELPYNPCKTSCAPFASKAPFGVKAKRFTFQSDGGPGPAEYYPKFVPCAMLKCSKAPFNSSSLRFQENAITCNNDDCVTLESPFKDMQTNLEDTCKQLTWGFKSKTIRFNLLVPNPEEPSPADLPQSRIHVSRLAERQYNAPFFSSEGRFHPWNDWVPVFGKEKTPGVCTYKLEKYKCPPAVYHGPLFRTVRFPAHKGKNPAPNEYKVGGGVETVLRTHNMRLVQNVKDRHKMKAVKPKNINKIALNKSKSLITQNIMVSDNNMDFNSRNHLITKTRQLKVYDIEE